MRLKLIIRHDNLNIFSCGVNSAVTSTCRLWDFPGLDVLGCDESWIG